MIHQALYQALKRIFFPSFDGLKPFSLVLICISFSYIVQFSRCILLPQTVLAGSFLMLPRKNLFVKNFFLLSQNFFLPGGGSLCDPRPRCLVNIAPLNRFVNVFFAILSNFFPDSKSCVTVLYAATRCRNRVRSGSPRSGNTVGDARRERPVLPRKKPKPDARSGRPATRGASAGSPLDPLSPVSLRIFR